MTPTQVLVAGAVLVVVGVIITIIRGGLYLVPVTLLVAGGFAVMLGGLFTIARHIDTNSCRRLGHQFELESKVAEYTSWSRECLVRVDGHWIPAGQLRGEVTR